MKRLYRTGAVFLVFAFVFTGAYRYRCHRLQTDLAERILRFHVIANSNTKEDQDLKLKIRDEIGAYLGNELSGNLDLHTCEQTVKDHLKQIEDCARAVIWREGYDYDVSASVKNTDFPEKTYGNYTFPRGNYRALRVVIGEGAGENWWCVMYPNLCFAGSVYEVADETAKEELKSVLTEEEYEEMLAGGKIKVKFKYLDAFLSLLRN
ncbi:MAG: stage II sporulation protein R [Eubacterium sp.]|nr:stage II sporulation protein R [Eubacterium sp.]